MTQQSSLSHLVTYPTLSGDWFIMFLATLVGIHESIDKFKRSVKWTNCFSIDDSNTYYSCRLGLLLLEAGKIRRSPIH